MKQRYLEITYRKGKPVAAYLYLPRSTAARATRTEEVAAGLLVDYTEAGEAIGIEITAPASVPAEAINAVLVRLGASSASVEELSPLRAA